MRQRIRSNAHCRIGLFIAPRVDTDARVAVTPSIAGDHHQHPSHSDERTNAYRPMPRRTQWKMTDSSIDLGE
jgi:hypothetical protein